jgi:glycogen operon protein
MIAFRKSHPSIGRGRYWRDDVSWHGTGPDPDGSRDSRTLAFHLRGATVQDEDIYVMVNAYWGAVWFDFQAPGPWHRVVNTGMTPPEDFVQPGTERIDSNAYLVGPRSICVFVK